MASGMWHVSRRRFLKGIARVPMPLSRAIAALLGVAAVLALATPVVGQDDGSSPRIDALKVCRAIVGDAERLACLDRASTEIIDAADRGEIRVLTRKDVEQTRRGLFGFNFPNLALFGGGKGDDDGAEMLETLESTVTTTRQVDRSTFIFKIAEGDATWQIKEAPSRFVPPKRGDKVVFKRASLSSYFIRINDRVGIKGRRID